MQLYDEVVGKKGNIDVQLLSEIIVYKQHDLKKNCIMHFIPTQICCEVME
jgi:hypothetical protein